MKRKGISAFTVGVIVVLVIWGASLVQAGGGFSLERFVIAGGGDTSSGGGFTLSGTIGQPLTAESGGGGYTLQSGFWPGAAACAAPEATAAPSGSNVQFTWAGGGTFNVYWAVDDPYSSGGAEVATNVSSGFSYPETLVGDTNDNAYYVLGPSAGCGERLGEFDFPIIPGV
jgi:hypothetical protein